MSAYAEEKWALIEGRALWHAARVLREAANKNSTLLERYANMLEQEAEACDARASAARMDQIQEAKEDEYWDSRRPPEDDEGYQ